MNLNSEQPNNNGSVLAVMVNWNGRQFLFDAIKTALEELQKQNGTLIVIDNASSDGSPDFIHQHFPEVEVIRQTENLGGSGGFNIGLRRFLSNPGYEYVWLLDNDILVEENALSALLSALEDSRRIGAVGSQICLYHNPDRIQEIGSSVSPWLGFLKQNHSGNRRLPASAGAFEVDYLPACSLLMKRSCLKQVGIFGNFFIYYDDVEWGLRAKSKGWKLLGVPASVVRHCYSKTKPSEAWREYYRKRNRLAVISAYPPRLGKKLCILVYTAFLNFSIASYRLSRHYEMFTSLLYARNDAISGRFGQRQLPVVAKRNRGADNMKKFQGNASFLIDLGKDFGDAIEAMNLLKSVLPNPRFYLPHHLRKYRLYFKGHRFQLETGTEHFDVVVLGQKFHLSSIPKGDVVCKYQNNRFMISPRPYRMVCIDMCKKLAAIITTIPLAPLHWTKLLRTYRDKGHSTFLATNFHRRQNDK